MWRANGRNSQRGEEEGMVWLRDKFGFFSTRPYGYQLLRFQVRMLSIWELRCTRGGERSLGLFRSSTTAFAVAELDLVTAEGNVWSGQ